MFPYRNKTSKAFTLVEMLVAMAIVAMVLASSLAVLGRISHNVAADNARKDARAATEPLGDLLTADLTHAGYYFQTPEGFMLKSTASLDAGTLELSHEAAIVDYRILSIRGRSCLVRSQQFLSSGKDLEELVCLGASGIAFEPFSDSDQAAATQPSPENWQPMTSGGVVTITFDNPEQAPLVRTVRTR